MAARSYVQPSAATTGSCMSSSVRGQARSASSAGSKPAAVPPTCAPLGWSAVHPAAAGAGAGAAAGVAGACATAGAGTGCSTAAAAAVGRLDAGGSDAGCSTAAAAAAAAAAAVGPLAAGAPPTPKLASISYSSWSDSSAPLSAALAACIGSLMSPCRCRQRVLARQFVAVQLSNESSPPPGLTLVQLSPLGTPAGGCASAAGPRPCWGAHPAAAAAAPAAVVGAAPAAAAAAAAAAALSVAVPAGVSAAVAVAAVEANRQESCSHLLHSRPPSIAAAPRHGGGSSCCCWQPAGAGRRASRASPCGANRCWRQGQPAAAAGQGCPHAAS